MHPWHDFATGAQPPQIVTAVIEIPCKSQNKYELDKTTGAFKLDRVLYAAVHYPGDYGLIPRTLAEDGDPADVLVLIDEPTFPGCCIDVRPIGLLRMLDRDIPDAKIIAVPVSDPFQQDIHDVDDLPPQVLHEIAHFFAVYKDLEGHRVHVVGWEPTAAAEDEIRRSMQRYTEQLGATRD